MVWLGVSLASPCPPGPFLAFTWAQLCSAQQEQGYATTQHSADVMEQTFCVLGLFSYLGKAIDDAAHRGGVEEAHGRAQDVAEQLLVHDTGGSHGAPGSQHGCKEQEESCKESTRLSPAHG